MQMKKSYKMLALIMTLVMVLCVGLTGCGKKPATTESLVKATQEKFKSAESASFDGTIDMDMSVSIFGQKEDMKASGKLTSESVKDELAHMVLDMSVDTAGETQQVTTETYAEKDGDKYVVYTNADDEWFKQEADTSGLMDLSNVITDKFFTEAIFEEKEKEYVVSGGIDVADAAETFGSMMSMDDMLGDLGEVDLTGVDKAQVVYHFDKETKDLTLIEIDMTNTMKQIFDKAMESLMAGEIDAGEAGDIDMSDLAGLIQFDVNKMVVTMNNFKFGDAIEIKVPDSVKENAKDMPDYSNWSEESDTNDSAEIPNPVVDYKDVASASAAVGFVMTEPKLDGYTLDEVHVIADEILELNYLNEDGASLIIRKAADSVGDITGDYNSYPNESKDVTDWVEGLKLNVLGWEEGVYNNVNWEKDGFAYAILSDADMTQEQMVAVINAIQ